MSPARFDDPIPAASVTARHPLHAVLRLFGMSLFWLVTTLSLALVVVPPFLDRLYYDGPRSAHYDGTRFFNPDEGAGEWPVDPVAGQARPRAAFMLRWLAGLDGRAPWPREVAVTPARPRALPPLKAGEMRATWVGHATVLVETPGLTMLTDPIWAERAGPFGLGPRRVAAPGIALADLPRIDLIVISHNHYDHMELATLGRLWRRDRPVIVTSLGNDTILANAGIPARALDWGQAASVGPARIVVTRNHHWGSRWGKDRSRALWSSFTVDTPSGSVFFAGDTGWGDGKWPAEAKAAAGGPIRLAIVPIGAFRFRAGQLWSGSHIGPHHAVAAFQGLGASYGLPVHWGTFRLSQEAYDTPPRMLALEAACAGVRPDAFRAHTIGAPVMIPAIAPSSTPRPSQRCDREAIAALR